MKPTARPMVGYVENSIGDTHIEMWFYKRVTGVWRRIKVERVTVKECEDFIVESLNTMDLIPLGRT